MVEPYHPDDAERLKPIYCQQWYRRANKEASTLRRELVNHYHHMREYTYRRYIWSNEFMYTLRQTTVPPRAVGPREWERFVTSLPCFTTVHLLSSMAHLS